MAPRREAVGIAIDGLGIKMAHLSLERGKVVLEALARDDLVTKLGAAEAGEARAAGEAAAEEDLFGLEEEGGPEVQAQPEAVEEEQSNASVVLSLLANVAAKRYHLGVNLPEARVDYYPFPGGSNLKGKGLKRIIREKIQADREQEAEIPLEVIQSFKGERDTLVGVVYDGEMAVLAELEKLAPYAKGMRIELIDTNETALADLVKLNYELGEEEVTAIVYIGKDSSRVVFLRGGEWIGTCPVVNEGVGSPQVCGTLLARILYEQDVSGVPDINRFVLAGEGFRIDAKSFFATEFPNADVDYLIPVQIDVGRVEHLAGDELSSYAVPLALAWKILDVKNPKLYPLNFLPARIKERQNVYQVGWHGILVMLLLGLCAYHFAYQWGEHRQQILAKDASIRKIGAQIQAKQDTLAMVDSLSARMSFYDQETALVDTLTRGVVRWSGYLERLARGTGDVGSLWFTTFKTGPDDIALEGDALFVAPLPRISYELRSSTVRGYSRKEIRGRNLYTFRMSWKLLETGTEVSE